MIKVKAPTTSFAMADEKTTLFAKGPEVAKFELDGAKFEHPIYTQKAKEAIIGADFLHANKAIIDMERGTIEFKAKPKQEPQLETTGKANPIETMVRLEFPKLFSGIGKFDTIKHEIKTGEHQPIVVPNRRVPYAYLEKISKHIQELLDLNIIEYSSGEWRSPIVPVMKKDGTLRLAVDYSQLNAITRKDAFPMPRIDDILIKVGKALIFSRLDLRKGYYQIAMLDKDKEKTAFAFLGKLYQFRRMPFGLCCAPQTFQRAMLNILGDLPFVQCYLDDVLIYSDSMEEHMHHVRQALERINKANLRLNEEKCQFGKSEIEFLGFKIMNGKKYPSEDKTRLIKNWPTPVNRRGLKAFLGLANYIRSMVPEFATLAKPLFEASNKKKLLWNESLDLCFSKLKEKLADNLVTHIPDPTHPFLVTCDASNTGMGAVLEQDFQGERKIVEFLSKSFNKAEKNYSTIEREACAIMYALDKWQHFLKGTEFTVRSDHRPLQWLLSMKNCGGKLGRLALKLAEYRIKDIEYIKGTDNEIADALSRIDVGLINDIPGSPNEKLQQLMNKAPDRFQQINNQIYLVERGTKRLCVTRPEQITQILKEIHDERGHLRLFKCQEAIRSRFYWPGWSNQLKRYLRQCDHCQIMGNDLEPNKEELQLQLAEEVGQRAHLDLVGPLSPSDGMSYIIAYQEAQSKWLEAAGLPDARTSTIINWLEREIFSRFGAPDQLTCDQGSQFESAEFKQFCERLAIQLHICTPYHHQSNGLIERANQTIEVMLRRTMGPDNQQDWHKVLPQCVFGYNTSVHHTTGVTPFSLMFSRKERLKIDRELNLEIMPLDSEINRSIASLNRALETAKQKYYYDRKVRLVEFKPDELVWWHVMEQGLGKSKKLNARWKGPFRIEHIDKPLVTLKDRNGKLKKVHTNHIKKADTNRELAIFRTRGRPRRLPGGCGGGPPMAPRQ